MKMFHAGASITEVRGMMSIAKSLSDKGRIRLSKLAYETGKNIDVLLPIVEAAEDLGLCSVGDGVVKLTKDGSRLNSGNFKDIVRGELAAIEPFRSAVSVLSRSGYTMTIDLSRRLARKGILYMTDEKGNTDVLRKVLVHWGEGLGLLSYDAIHDSWRKMK